MTVGELIKQLQSYDPTTPVYTRDRDGELDEITTYEEKLQRYTVKNYTWISFTGRNNEKVGEPFKALFIE